MKANTSTALVIPSTLVPKPNKNDIINAMVERARVKHEAEAKAKKEAKEAAGKKIEEAAAAEFARHQPSPRYVIHTWSNSRRVELEFQVTSPFITKMIAAYDAMPTLRPFDEKQVRLAIRKGMNDIRPNGVYALLENAEAVKTLDASLAHIGL